MIDEARLNYGDEAENAVINYFKKFGISIEKRLAISGDVKSIYENMKLGDLKLKFGDEPERYLNFDVKRGCFISDNSIKNYKGQFFILIPKGDINNIEKAKVVKSSTIRRYYSNIPAESRHTGLSGDKGYRFTKLKNFILLEEFVTELIKRLYILGDKYDYDKQISPMGELAIMFNKVLPRGADHSDYLRRFGRYYK